MPGHLEACGLGDGVCAEEEDSDGEEEAFGCKCQRRSILRCVNIIEGFDFVAVLVVVLALQASDASLEH